MEFSHRVQILANPILIVDLRAILTSLNLRFTFCTIEILRIYTCSEDEMSIYLDSAWHKVFSKCFLSFLQINW